MKRYYGAFGEVELDEIINGKKVESSSQYKDYDVSYPTPCWDDSECHIIAGQRGHVISGFLTKNGGCYYVTME